MSPGGEAPRYPPGAAWPRFTANTNCTFLLCAPPLLPSPSRPSPPTLKRLSPEEIALWRERELCFNCDEKYHRGHRCASRVFLLIIKDENPSLSNIEASDPPDIVDLYLAQISFNSIAGHLAPETLHFLGLIRDHQVVLLVDGGSTHNFIQQQLVTQLGLLPRATTPLRVMVRNGQQLECNCVCEAIIVDIQDTKFTIELYVLLISGANVVFGVQWLKLLGPVLTNYNSLSMKFFHDGCLVELKGDKKSTLNSLSLP